MDSSASSPAAGTGTASREHGTAADARRPPGQPVASRAPEYAVVPDASEADLLPALGARLAAGDQHALEQAYRLLGPSVMAYARRYVGPSEAPDVVQRVFTDVWRSAGRYDPARSLHAWVFTIARRRVVDELRRRRHPVVPLDEFRDVVRDQENDVAAGYADALTVRGMLGQLSPEQRTVLELAYFRGHTQAEIAARLDVPLGTVKARAARGLRRLAALLDDGESR